MQKLKDNWVVIAAIATIVVVAVVVIINKTKYVPVTGGAAGELQAKVDFKA